MKRHPACGQCGKPAIVSVEQVNLCVDCYSKFEFAQNLAWQRNAAMLNLAMADMDAVTGMRLTPRVHIPTGPSHVTTNHNISVSDSIVGAINTGTVREIGVSLSQLQNGGQHAAHDGLKTMTAAVIADENLSSDTRNEILEHLAFISAQAAGSPGERKPAIIRATFAAIREAVSVGGGLASIWQATEPVLRAVFGI